MCLMQKADSFQTFPKSPFTELQGFHRFLAPAKINLFLHITGKRSDGYHELQTVFRLLDFYDIIYLKVTSSRSIKRLNAIPNVTQTQDLCIRAAKLLQQYTHCTLGVDIVLEKNIPMGGGLGGGSSDAATVLIALNELWALGLSRAELQVLGLQLGADVPFFLCGTNAWAEGIGEKLQPIPLKEAYYVVLNPITHVSTAQIFANKQLTINTISKTMSSFLGMANLENTANLESVNSVSKVSAEGNMNAEFINALEKIVCANYPAVLATLTWLKQFGDARMTGSGASVFLEIESAQKAWAIYNQKPKDIFGFVAKGLNQHPLS